MKHVISALLAKRAEVAGDLQQYLVKVETLGQELEHLDGAIKVFDPSISLETIKPKQYRDQSYHFKSGECPRLVLDVLRRAGAALSTQAISRTVVELKAFEPTPDNNLKVEQSVYRSLRALERKNLVLRLTQEGTRALSWRIA